MWRKCLDKMANQKNQKTFTIRKKIAGAGANSIIVIPKLLQNELKKGTVVDVEIKVLEGAE